MSGRNSSLIMAGLGILVGVGVLWRVENGARFATAPWLLVLAALAAGANLAALSRLAATAGRRADLLLPVLFAVVFLTLWEILTRGLPIPMVLLPSPSAIGAAIASQWQDLALDFLQTVVYSALPGFVLGSLLGFGVAIAVDRSPFIQDGMLPLSNFASVVPIVGVAPIAIMWFGFGWESKVAIVVLMTFFPTFINTIAGLREAKAVEVELMMCYAASYWQMLRKLRLPTTLPLLFSALKINASLALIGAVVGEFFGTPAHGLGFRISAEIGRMAVDHVWAAIAVTAAVGIAAYGGLTLAERAAIFWHPSQREARQLAPTPVATSK
jgi:NitT/TauT family transport system permease protein